VVPFEEWHLDFLRLQPSQLALSSTLTLAHGRALQVAGPCYSAFAGARVLACAGIVEFWPGRSQVWSLLAHDWTRYTKTIHRAVKQFLAGYHVRRLECIVDPRDDAAQRWAEHLGFHFEGRMPAYTPQGDTQYMLVRFE